MEPGDARSTLIDFSHDEGLNIIIASCNTQQKDREKIAVHVRQMPRDMMKIEVVGEMTRLMDLS